MSHGGRSSQSKLFPHILSGQRATLAKQPLETIGAKRQLVRIAQLGIDHHDQRFGLDQYNFADFGLHLEATNEVVEFVLEAAGDQYVVEYGDAGVV